MEEIIILEGRLETAKDSEKLQTLFKLSELYLSSSPEKSLEYSQQALAQAGQLNDDQCLAEANQKIGSAYNAINNFEKALVHYLAALALFRNVDDKNSAARTAMIIGRVYDNLLNYDKSLEYRLQALAIYDDLGNEKGSAKLMNDICGVYIDLKYYDKALEYCNRALKISEKIKDQERIANCFNHLGIIHKNIKKYEQSLEYYLQALKIGEAIGNRYTITHYMNNIAVVYSYLQQYDKSLEYFLKALKTCRENDDKKTIAAALTNIGYLYLQIKDYDNSQAYLEQGLALAQEIRFKDLMQSCYGALSELHAAKNDFKKALHYYKSYTEIKDGIFTEESSKKIAEMQTKYETEKKEKEAEIYRLRNVELAEANRVITQAKEIIEEKNQHITSSIEYARRIQQAVLPPAGKMQAALPEHFVLYKPRDIVSGDFYWFSQTAGKILIAVVDCTGHGVPGASMSMIGSILLNTIVNEHRITDPALILEQMHNEVRFALRQEQANAESNDGMDVCLCSIDSQNNRLTFAGAKRPLYIVSGSLLTEIKGDGKSIGGRQREERRSFSNSEIAIRKGDMIYLSSDGYADQCDTEGRRIGSKRIKELLTEISGQEPAVQREALLSELERHQGSEEQRDDIAVMGVRIS